ncbi:glycosyltransferase family 39 protein [bacterium]|nr:glycosyltransferase family 39 protein [bacterium]
MNVIKVYKIELLIFIVLVISYGYFFRKIDWNSGTRLDLVWSIAEHHSLSIDAYHENTGDKAFYKGHFYTDKAPGISFLGVPFYFVASKILRFCSSSSAFVDYIFKIYIPTFFVVIIPSAIMGVIFYKTINMFLSNIRLSILGTMSYSLGTIVFFYSNMFYAHHVAGFLFFTALYILIKSENIKKIDKSKIFFSGYLLGLAILCEYPMVLFAVFVFIYLFTVTKSIKKLIYLAIPVCLAIIILGIYHYACFDNPLKTGYNYEYSHYFAKYHAQGISGIKLPKLSRIIKLTFGLKRGIFMMHPFLLFAFPGAYFGLKSKRKREFLFFISISAAVILFYSSFKFFAERFLITAIPFLCILAIYAVKKLKSKIWIFTFTVLAAISTVSMLLVTGRDILSKQLNDMFYQNIFRYLSEPSYFEDNLFSILSEKTGMLTLIPIIVIWVICIIAFCKINKQAKNK